MLFKILHGDKSRISTEITPYHEGYCYVTHDGDFYVDMNDERVKLNAKDAETLTGLTVEEILTSSQADWSVNNLSSPAYVQNRTHWMETELVAFIDNETLSFEQESNIYTTGFLDNATVFVVGNTYTFVIDGVSHDCVAKIFEEQGLTYIGNLHIIDSTLEDTFESFCVLCFNQAEMNTFGLTGGGINIVTTIEGD